MSNLADVAHHGENITTAQAGFVNSFDGTLNFDHFLNIQEKLSFHLDHFADWAMARWQYFEAFAASFLAVGKKAAFAKIYVG